MPKPWRTISPDRPELGVVDGLSYALFSPPGPPVGGVVILHGADSCKESHFDFARVLRANGLAAVAFDQRGHGESAGALGAGALDDVATIRTVLPPDLHVALRGSSMGGWAALAAAGRVGAAAVVALCPASTEGLLRGVREGRFDFAADRPALEELIASVDLDDAARRLSERLMLLHAEGDMTVPVEHSRHLHAVATGSRLVAVPGGHHRSVQHDPELQAASVRFILRALT